MANEQERLETHAADNVSPPGEAPSAGSVAQMIGTRNLLIIIVTMPFVFLAVTAAIIALLGRSKEDAALAAPDAPMTASALSAVASTPSQVQLDALAAGIALPAGASVGAIALDGDLLAMRLDSEAGAMIVIYDLSQEAILKTVPLIESD